MKLGLRSGHVELEDYTTQWSSEFLREKILIEKKLGNQLVDVIHFGGTSIPSCKSKPIIDIALIIDRLRDYQRYLVALSELDYGNNWIHILPGRICVTKGNPITHHIHIVETECGILQDWINFRNTLVANPKLVSKYNSIKTQLAKQFPRNRQQYTMNKGEFIRQTLKGNNESIHLL